MTMLGLHRRAPQYFPCPPWSILRRDKLYRPLSHSRYFYYQLYRGISLLAAVSADSEFIPGLLPDDGVRGLLSEDHFQHQVSPEFRQLCQQQVELLISALHISMLAAAFNRGKGSSESSGDYDVGLSADALTGTTLCCAVYSRAASSIQTGQLQLHLVAHSSTDSTAGTASSRIDQRRLLLGKGPYSLEDQENWIVEQQVIVLPDSGGLVLPLSYNGFLLGLLVVERGSPTADPGSPASPFLQPSCCTLLGPRDFQTLKQGAGVLAFACAMDLRATLDRAGNVLRQRQMRGLVQQARKPLVTLRTLGAMLAPRLLEGEPDRDMAEGIMAQGDRLAELVTQLQAALHPPPGQPPSQLPLDPAAAAAAAPFGGGISYEGLRPLRQGPLGAGGQVLPATLESSLWKPSLAGTAGAEVPQQRAPLPALPSANIGLDSVVRTIELEEGEWLRGNEGNACGEVSESGSTGLVGKTAGLARRSTAMVEDGCDASDGTRSEEGSSTIAAQGATPPRSLLSTQNAAEEAATDQGGIDAQAAAPAAEPTSGQHPSASVGWARRGGPSQGGGSSRIQGQALERTAWEGNEDVGAAAVYPALAAEAQEGSSLLGRPSVAPVSPMPSAGQERDSSVAGDSGTQVPGTDLLNVLMPLLATAHSFCARKGVTFLMLPGDSLDSFDGSDPGYLPEQRHPRTGLAFGEVAVEQGMLKRMLSQLVDGVMGCAAGGDCIEVAVHAEQYKGRKGVAVTIGCLQDYMRSQGQGPYLHQTPTGQGWAVPAGSQDANGTEVRGGNSTSHAATATFPQGQSSGLVAAMSHQPEFAFLASSARQAGGWFELQLLRRPLVVEDSRRVQHLNPVTTIAILWLPSVARQRSAK